MKKGIAVAHPCIWFFVEILNNTIQDTDLDVERLCKGIDITRKRKLKDLQKDSFLVKCKEKLVSRKCNLVQYIYSIANSISIINGELQRNSSSDVDDDNEIHQQEADCCVCIILRETTIVILHCRHAKCCENCSIHLQQCPICRSNIEQRLQRFT